MCVYVCVQLCLAHCDPWTVPARLLYPWNLQSSRHPHTPHSLEAPVCTGASIATSRQRSKKSKERLFGADDLLVLTVRAEGLKPVFIGSVCSTPLQCHCHSSDKWMRHSACSPRGIKPPAAQKSGSGWVEGTLQSWITQR